MRGAIISDIHANIFALEAVLADIGKQGADFIINLGDSLYGPIAPAATFERLAALDCITLQGNQDRDLYQAGSRSTNLPPTYTWVLEQLEPSALNWLTQLPKIAQHGQIFACHGLPDDDSRYLLEDVESGQPLVRSDAAIRRDIAGVTAEVIVCGHSHIPRTVWLESGQLIINPGSVGLPAYRDLLPLPHAMENYSPHARYCLLEKTAAGWLVEERRIPYPHQQAALAARDCGRPDWAYALMTGRAVLN
ncbi:metallophosphoesterase family protein [Halioxenophilus sp. WMMB6]|uniref:metallophosphoesterase family protein n=1 Tax=Halioxenophilus sp. WMMB6 TaxID=3073815 RepID=UPI00295EE4D1|nr:metallophosphoesterase family protein [Halioxenophilus sp. WMMB6]